MVYYFLSFIVGAAIGSFVQVVAVRLHVAPIIRSKSKCLSCGEALRVIDLIPVFSYLILRGKCRYCKAPYGIQALLVEVLYGFLYVLLYHFILSGQPSLLMSTSWFLYYSLLFVFLGVIALYDLSHTYIPTPFLLGYAALSLIMLGMRYVREPMTLTLLNPLVVALPFLIIWLLSRGRALGFGDVILFFGVGAFFGIEQGLAVLLISIWLGAIVGIVTHIVRRYHKIDTRIIPFVPFIVLGFFIVLFTDTDIFSIAQIFA